MIAGFTIAAALSVGCTDTAAPVTPVKIIGEWAKMDSSLQLERQ